MNKIKYSILLIFVLCISFNYGFANDVNDNSTEPTSVKSGSGSFSASIWMPLYINEVALMEEGGQVYVRGFTYPIKFDTDDITVQYTVHGEKDKDMYFTVNGTGSEQVNSYGIQIKDDGDGVKIKLEWKINKYSGPGTEPYSGLGSTAYKLKPHSTGAFGFRAITVKFIELDIHPEARPGEHVFTQTITVGYNPTY